jgi:hypothetical protein
VHDAAEVQYNIMNRDHVFVGLSFIVQHRIPDIFITS